MLTQTSRRPRLFSAHGFCVCKHFAGWFAGGRTWSNEMAVASLMVLASVSATANASLVAHWKLDDGSGTTAHDSSANGYHAEAIIGTPLWDSRGRYGGCLNFNGTYGLSLPPQTFANINKAISVCMWVNSHRYQPDDVTYLFKTKGIAEIEMRWKDDRVVIKTGRRSKDSQSWKDAKLKDGTGRWDHYVFVSDTTKSFQGIYLNGQLVAKGSAKGRMDGMKKVYFGANHSASLRELLRARIDDVRIYNHGLAADEVSQLYESGPPLPKIAEVAFEGEAFLNEHSPEEAIVFLDNKSAEVERWGLEDPAKVNTSFKETLFDLHFLLARAKQDAGRPQKEVEAAYERASKQGLPSPWFSSSVLLWLHDNGKTTEYVRIVRSLEGESVECLMNDVMAKAERLILDEKAEAAVKFMETNLAAIALWQEKHPHDDAAVARRLPHAYFQLAKAGEAAGTPKRDVADAYSKTFTPSKFRFVSERTAALIWLLENECSNEYSEVIKSFTQSRDTKEFFTEVVGAVCKNLESRKNWAAFERFLDTLFSEAKHRGEWAIFVESCLNDKTNRWAKRYFKYVDSKPRLKLSRDCVTAEKYVENKDFKKAAELYTDILKRCGPEDDKAVFAWELCKCLFHGSGYGQAVPKLESFIAGYKQTHRNLVKEAMLLKSSAHVQLGEPDKALESFSTLAKEYPETKNMPEVNFYVSYSYMLQGKSEAAEEAFERVIRDYPGSLYASKASICLTRIKDISEQARAGGN